MYKLKPEDVVVDNTLYFVRWEARSHDDYPVKVTKIGRVYVYLDSDIVFLNPKIDNNEPCYLTLAYYDKKGSSCGYLFKDKETYERYLLSKQRLSAISQELQSNFFNLSTRMEAEDVDLFYNILFPLKY